MPDLDDLANQVDYQRRWGVAPPSNGLQDLAARGLPPPQPTPFGIARAQEQQQRWGGTPDIGAGATTIAGAAGRGALAALKRYNDLIGTAATSYDPRESAYAGAELAKDIVTSGMGAAPKGALGMAGGSVKALHASPYNFERFDISKIGTGEGNTLRGYGLYFGEHPGVSGPGGYYDKQFTAQNLGKYELSNQEAGILRGIRSGYSDMEITAALAERGMPYHQAAMAVDRIRQAKSTIYDTNIKAPPDHFIDWDLPLDQQSSYVRNTLKKSFGSMPWLRFSNERVGDAFARFNEIEVAKELRQAGIPGFKFLDQFSRKGIPGRKTFNYVVNDDNLLNIMGKMGIAGFGALPGLGIYHYQRQDEQ